MHTDPVFRRTLDAVHHLSDAESPWQDVLDGFRHAAGGDSASFVMFDGSGAMLAFEQRNVDAAAERDYASHYHAHDIVATATIGAEAGNWFDTQELFTPASLSRSAYYVDYIAPHRMRQMLTFTIEEGTERRSALSVQSDVPRAGMRRQLESEPIRTLTGALQHALATRRANIEGRFDCAESAFHAFDEIACLATPTGALVRISQAARSWLEHRTGLRVREGSLWHPLPAARAALSQALAGTETTGTRTALTLPGDRGARSVHLDLAPADPRMRIGREPAVFVRMRQDRLQTKTNAEMLCLAFQVTAAEGRVLAALVDGQTPAAHAAAQGVSIHTVRKQIAVLRDKMGCKRQADLVRMALHSL